jgi:hypothetical protein
MAFLFPWHVTHLNRVDHDILFSPLPPSGGTVHNQSIAIEDGIDLEQLRARLHKMSDAELIHFGKAARFMCLSARNEETPRECFVIQLGEARAEWRRRKSNVPTTPI